MLKVAVLTLILGVSFLVLLAIAYLAPMAGSAAVQDKKMTAAFVANANNHITVAVRGWNRVELDRILKDFRRLYNLPENSEWIIAKKGDYNFVIAFPNDIQPKLLYFLVNYIKYPKKLDLTGRSIGVLASVVLTGAFGAPDPALISKPAVIYVPANDTDYDMVYVRIESDQAFKIPFTTLIWEPVSDARMPNEVSGL